MANATKLTTDNLLKENARLRRELDEAQQLIDAVRGGEVDALMIAGEGGKQLLGLGDLEKGYRELVEQMNEGAFTLSQDHVIVYANRRLAEMLETPLELLTGSRLDSWLSDESRDALPAFLEQNAARRSSRAEFVFRTRSGAPTPALLSLSYLPGDDWPLLALIATDLREQKRNEAIAAEERLARSILEQASDAIVVCDESGWVIRSSRAAQKLCGHQLIGSSFDQCFALQNDNADNVTLQQLVEKPKTSATELWFEDHQGRHRLEVSAASITASDGPPLAHVITLNDITEIRQAEWEANEARKSLEQQLKLANKARQALLSVVEDEKLTEQSLRDSESRFRLALSNLPISVWQMDNNLRYTWIYEHERQESKGTMVGKLDSELYPEADAAYLTQIKQQVLDTGESLSKEVYLTLDGELQFYNYYIEPQKDAMGEIKGISGAAVNITNMRELEIARKRLSDALKQSASAIAMLDMDLKFEFTNKGFDELFGLRHEETQGKNITIIAPPSNVESLSAAEIKQQVLENKRFKGELVRQKKGGELIPVYLTAAPLIDSSGAITGFVANYNDLRPLKQSEEKIREALTGTINAISLTIEKRDPYTAGHQHRVAELAVAIAKELSLDDNRIEGIHLGGLIHDIGKIYIPSEILTRPGKLASYEFDMIKSHPEVGYDIIKDVNFEWPIADMVYQHHERVDGSGYPQGLKGEEICLEARIIAVADVVEAMTSHRPYRAGLGLETALAQIKSDAGSKLDKKVVDSCLSLFRDKGFTWSSSF